MGPVGDFLESSLKFNMTALKNGWLEDDPFLLGRFPSSAILGDFSGHPPGRVPWDPMMIHEQVYSV